MFPVIILFYIKQRLDIIHSLKSASSVDTVGDDRCGSPGFKAKYGTYSFMDFLLIYVFQASNSVMVNMGFIDCRIENICLHDRSFVTDRHVQISSVVSHIHIQISVVTDRHVQIRSVVSDRHMS